MLRNAWRALDLRSRGLLFRYDLTPLRMLVMLPTLPSQKRPKTDNWADGNKQLTVLATSRSEKLWYIADDIFWDLELYSLFADDDLERQFEARDWEAVSFQFRWEHCWYTYKLASTFKAGWWASEDIWTKFLRPDWIVFRLCFGVSSWEIVVDDNCMELWQSGNNKIPNKESNPPLMIVWKRHPTDFLKRCCFCASRSKANRLIKPKSPLLRDIGNMQPH